jgi:hypothetical protein
MMEIITCKIEGCKKPIRIKKLGLCQMHETRFRNYGDVNYEREIIGPTQCKVENCKSVVYNKRNQLCMKHYQCLRSHGDINYKSQRKSLIPLHIPGGEIICSYPKAKLIMSIVSEIEKMIMCGYIENDFWSFTPKVLDLIPEQRCNSRFFYKEYIQPILATKECYTEYLPKAERILSLVDEIIKNGKGAYDVHLLLTDLESFGIKREKDEYYFIDSDDDVWKKYRELGIDDTIEKDYEICYKLKIHYKRYKKLTNDENAFIYTLN